MNGCTCDKGKRAYYVPWRDPSGKTTKARACATGARQTNCSARSRSSSTRAAPGTAPKRNIEFPAWIDEYETILASRPGIKGATCRSYGKTLVIAREAIGYVNVRDLGNPELRRFHAAIAHTSL